MFGGGAFVPTSSNILPWTSSARLHSEHAVSPLMPLVNMDGRGAGWSLNQTNLGYDFGLHMDSSKTYADIAVTIDKVFLSSTGSAAMFTMLAVAINHGYQ